MTEPKSDDGPNNDYAGYNGASPSVRHWRRALLLGCGAIVVGFVLLLLVRMLYDPAFSRSRPLWTQYFPTAEFLKQETLTDLNAPQADEIIPHGPEGDWKEVTLPYTGIPRTKVIPAASQGHAMTSWYRFKVTPPTGLGTMSNDISFYLPRWKTEGRLAIYQNGHLVWRSHGDIIWNSFNRPVLIDLPDPGPSVILLRMDTLPGLGGAITPAWAGQHNALFWRYRIRLALQCIVPGIFAVVLLSMAVVLFFVALARPDSDLYLLFVFAAILYTTRILHFLGPLDPTVLSPVWFGWATVNSMCWLIVVGWLFCCGLAEVEFPWLKRLLVWGMIVCSVATSPLFHSSATISALALCAYIFCFMLSTPTMPLLMAAMWRRRSGSGMLLLFWNMLMFPIAVHDMLMANYYVSIGHIYLLPYITPDLFLSCLYILCRRYINALGQAERSNQLLETRLRAQEMTLRDTYERLHQIEQRELLVAERQRLMRDMHDGLGSTLTGAIHLADHAASHAVLAETLKDCLFDLKLTVDSLEPVDADLLMLLANLRFRLAPRLHAQGVMLEWAVTPLPPLEWLTPSSALHVLRILQEVITNILKHAQASHIRLSTTTEHPGILVRIEDNGSGFRPDTRTSQGRGLHNIHWRANALAGRVDWHLGNPGTHFMLWLPIEHPAVSA
ncbi:MAG: ATP-binding protein [Acetobacter sp.]